MSGGQVMVVLIVLISVFGGVLKSRWSGKRHHRGGEALSARDDAALSAENHRLKGELADLRQRIQVLERVVTDNEGSLRLDREIEKLRDRRD